MSPSDARSNSVGLSAQSDKFKSALLASERRTENTLEARELGIISPDQAEGILEEIDHELDQASRQILGQPLYE